MPRYNTFQHTATYCNTLQHTTVPHCSTLDVPRCNALPHTAIFYRTLQHKQHSANYYITTHHAATRCNTFEILCYIQPYPMITQVKKAYTHNWFRCRIFVVWKPPVYYKCAKKNGWGYQLGFHPSPSHLIVKEGAVSLGYPVFVFINLCICCICTYVCYLSAGQRKRCGYMCACMYITHEIIEVLRNWKHTYTSEWVSSLALSRALPLSLCLTSASQPTDWRLSVCVYTMTPLNVSHDSFNCVVCHIRIFIRVRWLNHIGHLSDMSHPYLWHDSFICVTWLSHIRDETPAYVWYDLRDMIRSFLWHISFYAWHESSIHVTRLIQMHDMTRSYMLHDSFMCCMTNTL